MNALQQQEMVAAIAGRLVQVAPQGWARLVGNWEATLVNDEVSLNWITLGIVDLGDRWGAGQFGYDATLYDLVAQLNEAMAAQGERWTVLDLEVDRDGAYRTSFGYGPAKRTLGISDEESLGRFENYLDTWVAEHGRVPTGTSVAGLQQHHLSGAPMPEIAAADVDEYVTEITKAQPDWIRLVVWVGQLAEPDGSPSGASTKLHRIIVHDAAGVRAEDGRLMDARDAFKRIEAALEDVGWSELRIVADRDGQRDIEVLAEPLLPLEDSATDPQWEQVHNYLELNHAEVDALVERLRASGDLPGDPAPVVRRRRVLGRFRKGS